MHCQFYLSPTHLSMNGKNHMCLCLPSWRWSSLSNPEGMEGWVGLGTTTVSKQSAQDRYVMDITALLAIHTVTPHWASEHKQLAHSCYPEWTARHQINGYCTNHYATGYGNHYNNAKPNKQASMINNSGWNKHSHVANTQTYQLPVVDQQGDGVIQQLSDQPVYTEHNSLAALHHCCISVNLPFTSSSWLSDSFLTCKSNTKHSLHIKTNHMTEFTYCISIC